MDWLNRATEHLGLRSIGTGALVDDRPSVDRQKDYHLGEIVASVNPVDWIEKKEADWRKFPIFSQNGSGSCVAQTMAKLLGVLLYLKEGKYVHFSATHIYQRRKNKPGGGMGGVDAFDIARKGVTLEDLAPSQSLSDEQMDGYKLDAYKERVGEIFKITNYVALPLKDIDTVASVMQTTKKAVMVWFYFQRDEWTDTPTIVNSKLSLKGAKTLRHSVTAVDFTIVDGEKALIIEDSWGIQYGIGGRRIIKESFFKERNFFAAYPLNFTFVDETTPVPPPTAHVFAKNLTFIEWDAVKNQPANMTVHNAQKLDVTRLQEILKGEGLFPINTQSTGYYGAVTAKAVKQFQEKYKVASQEEINETGGRIVGAKTRTKLNELYGN